MPTKVLGGWVPQDACSFARGSMTRVHAQVVCVCSPVDPLHHAIGTPARWPKHLALDSTPFHSCVFTWEIHPPPVVVEVISVSPPLVLHTAPATRQDGMGSP